MLHIPVVTGNPPPAPLGMGNDHPVRQRVQLIHPAKIRKQLHRIFISGKHMALRISSIPGLRPSCTARIPDRGRLRHLHAYMRPVPTASAVPSPVVPRQELVHIPSRLNDGMDTGLRIRPVPVIDKSGCLWLRTPHGMDHQPLYRDLSSCLKTSRFRKVILDQLHITSPSLSFSA